VNKVRERELRVHNIMSSAKNQRDDAEFLARHAGVTATAAVAASTLFRSSTNGNHSQHLALLARQNTWQLQVQDLLQQHYARYAQSIQSVQFSEEWVSSYQETIRSVLQDEAIPLSATTCNLMAKFTSGSNTTRAAAHVPPSAYSGLKLVVPKQQQHAPSALVFPNDAGGGVHTKLTLRWTIVAPIGAPWFGPKDYKHHVYFMVRFTHLYRAHIDLALNLTQCDLLCSLSLCETDEWVLVFSGV
jgi:hypothetical protein